MTRHAYAVSAQSRPAGRPPFTPGRLSARQSALLAPARPRSYAAWQTALTVAALILIHGVAIAAPPHAPAHHGQGGDPIRFLIAGPVMLLIPASLLAATALIAVLAGSFEKLYAFEGRSVRRLEAGLGTPILWGLLVGLLFFAAVAALFAAKVGPLAVVVFLVGLYFLGLGIGAAATFCGRAVASAFGSADLDDLPSLRLGLWVLFLASCFPVIGWIAALVAGAAGLGAVAQSLLRRGE